MKDGTEEKDIWLWTTSEKLGEDHDFDSYRVFTWNLRKHRYETAYIQRRERGFFPVMAKAGEFSVCLEKPDGSRTRKRYILLGTSVRPAGDTPCEAKSGATGRGPDFAAPDRCSFGSGTGRNQRPDQRKTARVRQSVAG